MVGGMSLHYLRNNIPLPPSVLGIFCIGSFLTKSSLIYQNELRKLPVIMMHG
jgi:hypothetical protein